MTDDTQTAHPIEIVGYAVFDTETSALFDMKLAADDPVQGRLAQLAMIVTDLDFNPQAAFDFYVKPDGWTMSAEATAVNGLTDEFLMEHGVPVAEVLDAYEEVVRGKYGTIAYGAQFDGKVMRGEFRRAGRDDLFAITMNSCVMRSAMGWKDSEGNRRLVNLEKPRGWPKLWHCCQQLDIPFDVGQHTAPVDAKATLEVAKRLHAAGALYAPSIHYAKGKE